MSFELAQFKITDENLSGIKRYIKKPKDCVINVLEVLGIIDHIHADLMRIVVGDIGITKSQIEQIFKRIYVNYDYRFVKYYKLESLSEIVYGMAPGHVIFCGYKNKDNSKHVFLIGKNLNGVIFYIDPQLEIICDLSDERCLNYISEKQSYFVLKVRRN